MCRVYISSIILSVLLIGCSGLETKKVSSEELFTEAWQAIEITQVDTYPIFEACKTRTEKEQQRNCFEFLLNEQLQTHLQQYDFSFTSTFTDTLKVHFIIDEKGDFCIDSLGISPHLQETLPRLSLWIHDGLRTIPKAHPATKRGIPVKTQFQIPIVFQVQ